MKCSKCGFKARDINGMRKHYLKKHPGAMKRGSNRKPRYVKGEVSHGEFGRYCPTCGSFLGR